MMGHATRSVGLVVTSDKALPAHLLHKLRTRNWIAVSAEGCAIALEMMEVVDFSLVIVDAVGLADWLACRRLVEASRTTIAIITGGSADDRRSRPAAFQVRVAVPPGRLGGRGQLREILRRLERGDRGIELVQGAVRGRPDRAKPA